MGTPGAIKPSVFRKFLDMMDQVATAKEKENEIISRIQAVEAKHRFQRKHKALKHASPQPHDDLQALLTADDELAYQRTPKWWLWLLVLWGLLSMPRPKINQKRQNYTAD